MYMTRMLEIGVAANGYVVECRAALKPKKKGDGRNEIDVYQNSTEKQYIAKNEEELVKIINVLIPLVDKDKAYTSEDQFDAAFEEAVKAA